MVRCSLLDPTEKERWRSLLPASTSVFGSVEFASIQEQHGTRIAKLLVVDIDGSISLYPFLLRPLADLPFGCPPAGATWDAVTPEFTGPFNLSPGNADKFAEAVHRVFCDLGVVAEFMHLNPWHNLNESLAGGEVCFNREVVWVDTTLSEDELWVKHYSHACRKNLKRATRENVRVFEASGVDDVREVHRIYCETMDRNGALSSYYFPLTYFLAIFEQMRESAHFVLAEYKGQIVAATLYLHDDANVYSYLGGADYGCQEARPTNAIVHDTICWARRNKKQHLILGGGYQADDGIFRFKASFSNLRAAFSTFRRVHLPDQYHALAARWRLHSGVDSGSSYFPAYRSPALVKAASAIALPR